MKNILIPTTLGADTITAVKCALQQTEDKICTIVLLQLTEAPDSFSSTERLRSMRMELDETQSEILDYCREMVSASTNCSLKIHTQYSLTKPLLSHFLQSFEIGLVILTQHYALSKKSMDRYCVKLLSNCRLPILHIGIQTEHHFNKALYLQGANSGLRAEDLQQLVKEQFSFRIVSQTRVPEDPESYDIRPLLSETISRNSINLVVETRKPEKIKLRKKDKEQWREILGLPVLSLYEEII